MTDKKLKQLLKSAYSLPESDNSREFLKEHEKRTCRLLDVIKNEFRYMGFKSILAGIFLLGLFIAIKRNGDENMTWVISSIVPISSILPVMFILSSKKFGMCELEAASRFSLRFIRLIRMFIMGMFSSAVISCGGFFLRGIWLHGMLDILMYMFLPYFVSVWGCLLFARKWHRKESCIGVPMICIVTGFLPTIIREIRNVSLMPDYIFVILVVILMVMVVKECIEFVNEGRIYHGTCIR